jgi:biotin transporter BioY
MLTGGILGARNGLLVAVTVFLLSATVGSPLLAGCRAGVALWTGPSTGHLIGWLVGVVVIDLLTARTLAKYPLWEAVLVTLFRRSLRCVGVRRDVARHRTGFNSARASVLMYLPGGLFNAIVAALVKQVHRSRPADRASSGPEPTDGRGGGVIVVPARGAKGGRQGESIESAMTLTTNMLLGSASVTTRCYCVIIYPTSRKDSHAEQRG